VTLNTQINTEHNLSFAQALLEHLFFEADCYIRLLYLKGQTAIERYFRPVEIDSHAFRDEIESRIADQYNVFYSVCGRSAKSGKLEAVGLIPALWLDLDAKDFEGGLDEAAKQFYKLPTPTYIINSGHGYHGLWLLKPRIDATNGNKLRVSCILRGLASTVKADACYDLSRMLRLPETINFKDNPITTHIVFWSNAEYTLEDFSQYEVETPPAVTEACVFDDKPLPLLDVATLRVSDKIKALITKPPEEGNRSQAVYAVVKSLQKAGYSPDEILSIIYHNRIGDRYGE
jgi:hypothetical protein